MGLLGLRLSIYIRKDKGIWEKLEISGKDSSKKRVDVFKLLYMLLDNEFSSFYF